MDIVHPTTSRHLQERDQLLQESLRPEPLAFPISAEYPLVLGASTAFSYCALENDAVIAHLNLWPRRLRHSDQSFNIGFVGNVATRKEMRGLGIMSKLLTKLVELALSQRLEALVLWSDLHSFYQKQGFEALGKELRFLFNRSSANSTRQFFPTLAEDLSEHDLTALLRLAYSTPGRVDRSTDEFRALLTIPQTAVFIRREHGQIAAFGIVGKGYDMAGVVHEWGCHTADEAIQLVYDVKATYRWPETMLLCPGSLDASWDECLTKQAAVREEHPMALVHAKKDSAVWRCLQSSFIWGLDSI